MGNYSQEFWLARLKFLTFQKPSRPNSIPVVLGCVVNGPKQLMACPASYNWKLLASNYSNNARVSLRWETYDRHRGALYVMHNVLFPGLPSDQRASGNFERCLLNHHPTSHSESQKNGQNCSCFSPKECYYWYVPGLLHVCNRN